MFDLPASTIVNRNIPKNSFEDFANSKQKKVLTNTISKIRWINKLSTQTINLEGKEVKEIQIIEITLKQKESDSASDSFCKLFIYNVNGLTLDKHF